LFRYTAACSKLLVQIKAAFKQLSDDEYPSVEEFVRKCKVITLTECAKSLNQHNSSSTSSSWWRCCLGHSKNTYDDDDDDDDDHIINY